MKEAGEAANRELIGFYAGDRPDDRGRLLADILHWPDERLEAVHDFIQWLFPLTERSAVNPRAPLLDRATICEFRGRPDLQQNLCSAFLRMLRFYGLEMQTGAKPAVVCAAGFEQRALEWLRPGNHNHLRITRIIKCLRLLGLEEFAQAFYKCLVTIYQEEARKSRPGITAETLAYWQSAADQPAE